MNKNLHRTNAKIEPTFSRSRSDMNILLPIYMTVFMSVKQQKHKCIYNIYIYIIIHPLYADGERMGKRLKICFRKQLLVIGSKPFRTVQNYFLVNSFKPFRTVRSYSLPQNDCYPTFFPNSCK